MERSIGLAFTTLTIFAPLAHAAHPKQAVKPEGTASPFEFVAPEPLRQGYSCGEYEDRTCGVNGSTCRQRQNSVALLEERLGARGAGNDRDPAGSGMTGGCTAAGGLPSGAMALALAGVLRRRRRR